jgi:hypothetical protein
MIKKEHTIKSVDLGTAVSVSEHSEHVYGMSSIYYAGSFYFRSLPPLANHVFPGARGGVRISNVDNLYIAEVSKGTFTESLRSKMHQNIARRAEGIERKIRTGTI